jgi:hypothetical protein
MAVCEFWLPSYFLHVMTGHSFKNMTWPIFTIIMLACEHCLPWCISYVSWQVSKMMTWQGVNFGCPDVFPMCHDRSAKWWHGRVWTLVAQVFPTCHDGSLLSKKSDMADRHDYHASVWALVILLYFLRVMTCHHFQRLERQKITCWRRRTLWQRHAKTQSREREREGNCAPHHAHTIFIKLVQRFQL